MDIKTALKRLLSDPKDFLRKHPIFIGSGAHGRQTYYVDNSDRPKATRITAGQGRVVPATEGLRFNTAMGEETIQAWSVKVHQWGGKDMTWLAVPAPAANEPQFILTGLLTGCSFVVEVGDNGGLRCAHELHGKGPNSEQLRKVVAERPGLIAYTSGDQYDHFKNQAHVIGIAQKGKWKLYAQRQNADFGILGVDRIL
jgi:hypothetical protein